jgi:drug/metabolite transporter (DMT)-like permease
MVGEPSQRMLLSIRGITSSFGLILLYFALRFIPPSDLSAIGHTSIIVTALLSRMFLKEKLGIPHLFSLSLTVFGVLVISKPSFLFDLKLDLNSSNKTNSSIDNKFESQYSADFLFKMGIGLVIGSAILFGSVQIMIKKLCNSHVHWSISTIYGAYFGFPVSSIISIVLYIMGYTHQSFDLKLLIIHIVYSTISAILGIIGQCCLNIALQYEDATKVSIAKTSDVIFAFVLQLFLLNIKIDFLSVIGSVSIVFGTFVVLGFKLIEKKYSKIKKSKKLNPVEKFLFFKF